MGVGFVGLTLTGGWWLVKLAPNVSLAVTVLVGAAIGGTVALGIGLFAHRQKPEPPPASAVGNSQSTEPERRAAYADFMRRVDETWVSAIGRKADLDQRLAELEHAMNLIGPLIPSVRDEWNRSLQDFKKFAFSVSKDRPPRTAEVMRDRGIDFAVFKQNFQEGLFFALFGGTTFKRVSREDVKSVEMPDTLLTEQPEKPPKQGELTLINSSLKKDGPSYTVTLEVGNIGDEAVHANVNVYARGRFVATGEIQELKLPDSEAVSWLFEPHRAMRREQQITLHGRTFDLFKSKQVEITVGLSAVYPAEKPTTRYLVEGIINDEMTGFNVMVNRRDPISTK